MNENMTYEERGRFGVHDRMLAVLDRLGAGTSRGSGVRTADVARFLGWEVRRAGAALRCLENVGWANRLYREPNEPWSMSAMGEWRLRWILAALVCDICQTPIDPLELPFDRKRPAHGLCVIAETAVIGCTT